MSAQPSVADSPLLDVHGLSVVFDGSRRLYRGKTLTAVDDVSFELSPGTTLGIVGESGSGKTTVARTILGLQRASGGTVHFAGRDITSISRRPRRLLTRELQAVFQNPYGSLNPTRTVASILYEPLRAHNLLDRSEGRARAVGVLERVGLGAEVLSRYPAEFSGGQLQRIAIARALMLYPRLVVCDEPVSALDLSVQAQVLNLLRELQRDLGLSFLFIAHNLAVVRYVSRDLVVLYRGRVMEMGGAEEIYQRPRHPYTRLLLESSPVADPVLQRERRRAGAGLEVAGPSDDAPGCNFAPRCPFVAEACRKERPELRPFGHTARVACLLAEEIPPMPKAMGTSLVMDAAERVASAARGANGSGRR
jgi:oligopeptide/dipeptide ABC transporter ATP-binding protein